MPQKVTIEIDKENYDGLCRLRDDRINGKGGQYPDKSTSIDDILWGLIWEFDHKR